MSDLFDIIAQETQDGRLIVRFLVSAMNDQLPDFKPSHRLSAARLPVKRGFERAQPLIDQAAAQRTTARREPQSRSNNSEHSDHRIRSGLAQIVREETQHGLTTVRFLIDVTQGALPDFLPCHRLSAAKELLHRGFDSSPEDQPVPEDHHPAQPAPEPEPDPAEIEAQRRRAEGIEFSFHGELYYRTIPYPCPCEDYLHDCNGNTLDEPARERALQFPPAGQFFLIRAFRGDRLRPPLRQLHHPTQRRKPQTPIDINRILWRPELEDWIPPILGP